MVVFACAVGFLTFVTWWAAFALTGDVARAVCAAAWVGFGGAEAGLLVFLGLFTAFFATEEAKPSASEIGEYAFLLALLFLGGGFLGVLGCAHWATVTGKRVGDLAFARICLASALVFPVAALIGLAARAARRRARRA